MLFAINLYEDFIDVEGVTVALMLSFQTAGIFCAEFDAPETDRFVRDGNASFSEQIFDISMTHSDILAQRNGGEKYVSIELKYKSAVTDQFKCRSYDAMHMKNEYSSRMLCVMLFVKSNAGVSIGQAEKICHPFDRFIGVPVADIGDSGIWKGLADEISTFL